MRFIVRDITQMTQKNSQYYCLILNVVDSGLPKSHHNRPPHNAILRMMPPYNTKMGQWIAHKPPPQSALATPCGFKTTLLVLLAFIGYLIFLFFMNACFFIVFVVIVLYVSFIVDVASSIVHLSSQSCHERGESQNIIALWTPG